MGQVVGGGGGVRGEGGTEGGGEGGGEGGAGEGHGGLGGGGRQTVAAVRAEARVARWGGCLGARIAGRLGERGEGAPVRSRLSRRGAAPA